MAWTAGVCYSFKTELLSGVHSFIADAIKVALYTQAGNASATPSAITVYFATGENAGANYTAGGNTMAGNVVAISTSTAYANWSTNPTWTSATITSDACLIYNGTNKNSTINRAIALYTFGSTVSTAGTWTLVLPANGASSTLTIA